ncbi:leucine-rich repeat domain-containing protein [Weissella confusa]|uniref:Cell surface protein n=1 Tax=Weissella confusa TaxID=1583 RepID=A0A4Z0RYE1_WEICO|nr:leucine-rich repeat domain-containing protein [Weissella confusa]TGE74436.1 hypothetical protein C6P11_03055 [Weissella confusa]
MKRFTAIMLVTVILASVATDLSLPRESSHYASPAATAVFADDSYLANTLSDYQIPKAVIQTILDNSLLSDGKTPTADGMTVANFTIADFQKLTTVSLATRTKNDDGSYSSKMSDAVANDIGSVKVYADSWQDSYDSTAGGVIISQNYEGACGNDKRAAMSDILQNGMYKNAYYLAGGPVAKNVNVWLNYLIAMIGTNTAMTTLDLTGAFSEMTYNTAMPQFARILGMMQIGASNVETLQLGSNPIMSQETNMNDHSSFAFSSSTLKNLDISNNGFTTLNTEMLGNMSGNLTNLNLAGNQITSITTNATTIFDKGSVDLSDAKLANDPNTNRILVSAINSGNGGISLGDEAVNTLVSNTMKDAAGGVSLNTNGLNQVASQLDSTTVDKLVTTSPALIDNKVLNTLVTSNATALTGDNFAKIAQTNPAAIDEDTLASLLTKNPDVLTPEVVQNLATSQSSALTPEVLGKIA